MKTVPVAQQAAPREQVSPSVWLLRIGALGLTFIIFLIDWLSTLDVAIAVLYVVVILISGDLFSRRGVALVSIGCGVLTLMAYLLSHGDTWLTPAFARCLVSLAAIAITGFLALKFKASHDALLEQVELLHRSQSQLAHVTRVTTLGELAASIAHEVNQPLSAVTTNAEAGLRWLNREVPDLGEVRSAIDRIKSEAHRASEVIRRIRALSRKTDPMHVQLDLREVLQESAALVQREILRHRVHFTLERAREPMWVKADRVQLQQVIINLLINALQAMSGMHGKERSLLAALGHNANGDVCLRIVDNGPGIAASNLPNLFNPFFTTKPEGMGMGLSICRSIIDAHGGRLWAESELGRGAALNFSLPAHQQVPS